MAFSKLLETPVIDEKYVKFKCVFHIQPLTNQWNVNEETTNFQDTIN